MERLEGRIWERESSVDGDEGMEDEGMGVWVWMWMWKVGRRRIRVYRIPEVVSRVLSTLRSSITHACSTQNLSETRRRSTTSWSSRRVWTRCSMRRRAKRWNGWTGTTPSGMSGWFGGHHSHRLPSFTVLFAHMSDIDTHYEAAN